MQSSRTSTGERCVPIISGTVDRPKIHDPEHARNKIAAAEARRARRNAKRARDAEKVGG